ncbi:MAG: hypothetical protein HQL95_09295, partial [Magnetococcales bacterium]|nr:hypothetical protein [Magnetococcales bacterium]
LEEVLQGVVRVVEAGCASLAGETPEQSDAASAPDPAILAALVEEMLPHVRQSRPRPCLPLVSSMMAMGWTGDVGAAIARLEQRLRKYRMKEALQELEALQRVVCSLDGGSVVNQSVLPG